MRYLWLLLAVPFLLGMTAIQVDRDNFDKVNLELENIYLHAQDEQYDVIKTTPALSTLKDGQMVIYSSGAVKLMFRSGQEIYSVNVSCITVHR